MRRSLRKNPALGGIESAPDGKLIRIFSRPHGTKPQRLRPIGSRNRQRQPLPAGFFDTLPLEILDTILLDLDYRSLAQLCRTNSKAEAYIKKAPYIQPVLESGDHVLSAMADFKVLHLQTARRVYSALTDRQCSAPGCSTWTESVFLPNCRRVCIACIGKTSFSAVLTAKSAQKRYKLSELDVTLGLHKLRLPKYQDRDHVVLDEDARALATALGVENIPDSCLVSKLWSELFIVPFPYRDRESGSVEWLRQCLPCYDVYFRHSNIWNHISYDPDDDEWEAWEKQLEELKGPGLALYGPRELVEHVRSGECRQAEKFWVNPKFLL